MDVFTLAEALEALFDEDYGENPKDMTLEQCQDFIDDMETKFDDEDEDLACNFSAQQLFDAIQAK